MPYSDLQRQREAEAECKRRRRAAGDSGKPNRPTRPLIDAATRLRTAADVLILIEDQVNAVTGDQDLSTVERARTIGYLSGIALRAIEAADLASRVEAIESVLGGRARA